MVKHKDKTSKEEPHVEVFGEEVKSYKRHHRCHSGSAIWGLLFLFGGGVLLLNNFGVIPWNFWDYVWGFWPALLVIIGIRVVLGHNILSRLIVFVITLVTFGLILIYGLSQVNSHLLVYVPQNWINLAQILNQVKK
jgi:hypothetical protein